MLNKPLTIPLHCNKCFRRHKLEPEADFYVSTCDHVVCDSCVQTECPICLKPYKGTLIREDMPRRLSDYFWGKPLKLLRHFQLVTKFQYDQEQRYVEYLTEKNEREDKLIKEEHQKYSRLLEVLQKKLDKENERIEKYKKYIATYEPLCLKQQSNNRESLHFRSHSLEHAKHTQKNEREPRASSEPFQYKPNPTEIKIMRPTIVCQPRPCYPAPHNVQSSCLSQQRSTLMPPPSTMFRPRHPVREPRNNTSPTLSDLNSMNIKKKKISLSPIYYPSPPKLENSDSDPDPDKPSSSHLKYKRNTKNTNKERKPSNYELCEETIPESPTSVGKSKRRHSNYEEVSIILPKYKMRKSIVKEEEINPSILKTKSKTKIKESITSPENEEKKVKQWKVNNPTSCGKQKIHSKSNEDIKINPSVSFHDKNSITSANSNNPLKTKIIKDMGSYRSLKDLLHFSISNENDELKVNKSNDKNKLLTKRRRNTTEENKLRASKIDNRLLSKKYKLSKSSKEEGVTKRSRSSLETEKRIIFTP